MGSTQPIRRVAIVGAGPSGLATAKYLLAERAFECVDIFEQRSDVGGIWNLSSPQRTKQIPIPQTNPRYPEGEPVPEDDVRRPSELSLELESPLYDYLETNIPKELMVFSDQPLPKESPLFIGHEETLQYLQKYAQPIRHLISFNSQVEDVREADSSTDLGKRWQVTTTNLLDPSAPRTTNIYDAVAVANGHYTIPFIPLYPGLEEWNMSYPDRIIHSKSYRLPEMYRDQKVLIIGNSVSGLDIAQQIAPYASTVLLSSRSASNMVGPPSSSGIVSLSAVSRFLPAQRAVEFTNSHVGIDIDSVIFATGYFYNYPFLRSLDHRCHNSNDNNNFHQVAPLTTHGLRTNHTYQHLFYTPNPTLGFLILNLKIIPFPLAENQAAVLSRVWSGRLALPSTESMRAWETSLIAQRGEGKEFHLLKSPDDADYLNMLYRWAETAEIKDGLENDGVGKLGTYWDERLRWMRLGFPEIKARYAALGEKRRSVRTVEELGFNFSRWKQEQKLRKDDQDTLGKAQEVVEQTID